MGFGAEVAGPDARQTPGELLAEVEPDDLLKFGLDPGVRRAPAGGRGPCPTWTRWRWSRS